VNRAKNDFPFIIDQLSFGYLKTEAGAIELKPQGFREIKNDKWKMTNGK